jgi:hypothetical protein
MRAGDKEFAFANGMTAMPITRAAAQATVRGKQANEARISRVPFFREIHWRWHPPSLL